VVKLTACEHFADDTRALIVFAGSGKAETSTPRLSRAAVMLKSDGSKTSLACAPTPTARTPTGTRHVIFIVARCCYQLREYRTTWQRVRGQLLASSSQRRVEVWGAKGSALGGSVRNDIDPSAARLAVSIQIKVRLRSLAHCSASREKGGWILRDRGVVVCEVFPVSVSRGESTGLSSIPNPY
jgi:hypothetical protein